MRTASSTPGMNDSRAIESWRTESVWPRPPKMTSWCATRPGQAHRVDRLVHVAAGLADQLGGAQRGARGRVELLVVVQLDDLALGHVLRDRAATTCIISTAPIAKLGAKKRFALPTPSSSRVVDARSCRSRSARRPRGTARALSSAVSGVEKSTTTSASPQHVLRARRSSCGSARPTSAMSSAPSTAAHDRLRPSARRAGDRDVDHA